MRHRYARHVVSAVLPSLAFALACGGGGDGGSTQQQVSREDAVRACVFVGSCIEGVADCFTDILSTLSAEDIRCMLDAGTSCAAVHACLGFQIDVDTSCTPGCEGDTLVDCAEGGMVRSTLDCGAYYASSGSTCVEGNLGPDCGVGTCAAEESRCDGTALVTCDVDRGVLKSGDCARNGWTCVEEGDAARCTDGTSTACAGGARRCDGDSLVLCASDFELALDCGLTIDGRGCHTAGLGSYCGFGVECDPVSAKGRETCAGTVITFCAGGSVESVNCAELGYTGCMESLVGGGRCVP